MGNMGSAHPLVEVNVSFKFEGNPCISKGVMETDGFATKRIQYSPPTFCSRGIIMAKKSIEKTKNIYYDKVLSYLETMIVFFMSQSHYKKIK